MEQLPDEDETFEERLGRLAGKLVTPERFGGRPEFELCDPVEQGWKPVVIEGMGLPSRPDRPRAV